MLWRLCYRAGSRSGWQAVLSADTSQILLADHNWDGPGAWWPIFPILWLLVVATIVAGILAAVLPARRASRLNVLEALQYE